ncbi:MAG TPA: DeoR/GlpR transcriptional regulator [Clostridiales bacterium]|jgi:DeoR/GlpR family transcriptional regulator of sugar metabolism|nr:DeoR/GlpR transcriptional regulator [Clostridiales bacterium]
MLAIERRAQILEQLKREKRILINQLSVKFGVSEETIRRDMEKLEQEGYVTRTYGGAVYNEDTRRELPYEIRKRTNVDAKLKIASAVADLISDGDYIMLDESTTSTFVARALKGMRNITLITNSVEIVLELASDVQGWNIFCTGGLLKSNSLAFTGKRAESMIESYHVNVTVISCEGIDLEAGYTDSREETALLKRSMMASAKKVILAADSKKFGKVAFINIGRFADLDVLVTDADPGPGWRACLEENGVKLVIA